MALELYSMSLRMHLASPAGGFLTDHFPSATKAIWDFEGEFLNLAFAKTHQRSSFALT